ncbi:DNA replication/repair protein RecF [Aliiglaciecola litoralis]|uniref:DNA replication and repair protein RecF n=1 Tax=Aliiglaciecola litoralis TaxID=582857 RepID=A0ABP3X358_9ALTE
MKLDTVQIHQFRNLANVEISPSDSLNFIFGKNGSGKSSLLEAIHYLGFGRSFRTSKHKNVIQYDAQKFSIFALSSDEKGSVKLGMSRSTSDELVVSVNGNKSNRMSELVSQLPIQIFTPQSSELVLGSPSLRRRFLDWGLFHVEQSFGQSSQNYQKILKQKNALLRKSSYMPASDYPQQMAFWDKQIVKEGEMLTKQRKAYLEAILEHINSNLVHFLPEFSVEISYHRGWEKEATLEEAILKKSEKDIKNGYLSVGPHKADLRIRTNGVDVAEVLSRGQLRMLVAALQLAQIQFLKERTNKSTVFLLDDVGAELDETKRELFIDKLLEINSQLFISAIEKSQLPFINKYKNKKMFHVEHGRMREES